MSAEHNAALVRRYFEECVSGVGGRDQRRSLAVADDLLAADFVMYYNNETEADATRGHERHKEFLVEHERTFPDDDWTVEALVADEDVVACWRRIRARHAVTGNPIDVCAADFLRVRDRRLAELRRFLDFRSLNRQTRPPGAQG
jgi:ketosteroid isomerase-like protein